MWAYWFSLSPEQIKPFKIKVFSMANYKPSIIRTSCLYSCPMTSTSPYSFLGTWVPFRGSSLLSVSESTFLSGRKWLEVTTGFCVKKVSLVFCYTNWFFFFLNSAITMNQKELLFSVSHWASERKASNFLYSISFLLKCLSVWSPYISSTFYG